MAAKAAINLNEKMPSEEDAEIAKALDSADSATLQPQPVNGSADDSGEAEGKKTSAAAAAPLAPHDPAPGPEDAIQKKMRRAERFGLPVQLTEAEKRSSRAERFGTSAGTNKPEALRKSEELKRKARAERFGTVTPTPDGSDEEAKKKARLAKFASGSAKLNPDEEEKRKARSIRFSNPSPSSSSQVNGKQAIAGKTTS